jgi:predicted transport protein
MKLLSDDYVLSIHKLSQLEDPMKKARDVKKIGHYSHGDTEIVLSERGEIPYSLSLIRQAYERS